MTRERLLGLLNRVWFIPKFPSFIVSKSNKMIKTLKIEDITALKLYKTADAEFKILLEENFGKDFFNQKITDKIRTWKDICKYLNIDEENILPYYKPKSKLEKSVNAFVKINKISEVLNEGWAPDFNNINEYKYYPYFKKSGRGWVVLSFYCWFGTCVGGSGCYFKSSELALYAGNIFLDIYSDYLPA